MKRSAVTITVGLALSMCAFAAPKPEAPAVKVVKAPFRATAFVAVKTAHGVAWLFKSPAPKPAKKADGSGPICCPHSGCCWTKPPRPPAA